MGCKTSDRIRHNCCECAYLCALDALLLLGEALAFLETVQCGSIRQVPIELEHLVTGFVKTPP